MDEITSNRIRIKDMPEDERPREKLMKYGADKLTDAELMAILISSGTREKSALELSKDMLNNLGGFRGIAGRRIDEITNIKGVKTVRAINIAASFEIARRIVNDVLGVEDTDLKDE